MEKTITASDAYRSFSAMLREVAGGNTYTITNHGRVVARLIPPQDDTADKDQLYA